MSRPFACVTILTALLAFGRGASAADQTEHVRKSPTVLPVSVTVGSVDVTYQTMRELMSAIFPGQNTNAPEFYCVVHILKWADDPTSVEASKWYVYRGGGTGADRRVEYA